VLNHGPTSDHHRSTITLRNPPLVSPIKATRASQTGPARSPDLRPRHRPWRRPTERLSDLPQTTSMGVPAP